MSEHKSLRFDGVKYYMPHGAKAVTIDGQKHFLCVPVKGKGAVRAIAASEVAASVERGEQGGRGGLGERVSPLSPPSSGAAAPHVPYAHKAICRFDIPALERRWLLILGATLALLAALLGCR